MRQYFMRFCFTNLHISLLTHWPTLRHSQVSPVGVHHPGLAAWLCSHRKDAYYIPVTDVFISFLLLREIILTNSRLRGKRNVTVPGRSPPLWGSQGRSFQQLIMPHPQSGAERSRCTQHPLLACRSGPQLSPSSLWSHTGLGLPTSVDFRQSPHRQLHRPSQRRWLFTETLIPGDPGVCQVAN